MTRLTTTIATIALGIGSVMASSSDSLATKPADRLILNHLDVGLTLGTTGIGVELALPVTQYLKVRTGAAFMPQFSVPLHFDMMTYGGENMTETSFDKAQDLLKSLTGYDVDQNVTIDGKPTMYTFKFLVDVYPFRNNKHWHFTAGFYLGNKKIAKAVNAIEESTTMVSVGMYNSLYDYFTSGRFIDEPLYGDYYIDPDVGDQMAAKFSNYGRMGVHMGNFKDGTPFYMEPGRDGTMRAEAVVNTFRPYLGFGYGGFLDKQKKFAVALECGAMFWGGNPKIITYNGVKENKDDPDYAVDLTRDVTGIKGKVGDYVSFAKALKVLPVLNFRITYNIF